MKLLRHILRENTNIQLFYGSVFLRCGYANTVFSVNDLYELMGINVLKTYIFSADLKNQTKVIRLLHKTFFNTIV